MALHPPQTRLMDNTAILANWSWAWDAAECAHRRAMEAIAAADLPRYCREVATEKDLDYLADLQRDWEYISRQDWEAPF